MTNTGNLWGTGFALLGGAVALDMVKQIQGNVFEEKDTRLRSKHHEHKHKGYRIW